MNTNTSKNYTLRSKYSRNKRKAKLIFAFRNYRDILILTINIAFTIDYGSDYRFVCKKLHLKIAFRKNQNYHN